MLMELGRGPLDFRVINVETALEEKILDLPLAARGFRLQDRAGTAALRISQIKGEVSKATTADPKPLFWTIPSGEHYDGILGIRVMTPDAQTERGEPLEDAAVAAGAVLEQRYYITSDTADTDIELFIVMGF